MKKKKKVKAKREKDKEYILLQAQIQKYQFHKIQQTYEKEKTNKCNTWFDTVQSTTNQIINIPDISDFKQKNDIRKTKQVEILFNKEQQKIFQSWIKAYIRMYNETLKYIKASTIKCYNYKKLRTYHIKDIRDGILAHTNIQAHMLDAAIKLACANYKSALTNKHLGYIKHFRIRYWRYNKSSTTIEIEKGYFRAGTICKKIFGMIKCKDFDMKDVDITSSIRFDKPTNKYILCIPEKISKFNSLLKNTISLDPGIHTFMTGVSNDRIVKYGNESYKMILSRLTTNDKIKINKNIPSKIKKKILKRNNNKIRFKVDELHWKVANDLTNNYKNILIGDMSVKGITKKITSCLNNMHKRVAYALKFYTFRQRLENKCIEKDCRYKKVNEKYTSKTCSNCGYYKENLGGSRIYKCNSCKSTIDRDVNGSKCILLKALD